MKVYPGDSCSAINIHLTFILKISTKLGPELNRCNVLQSPPAGFQSYFASLNTSANCLFHFEIYRRVVVPEGLTKGTNGNDPLVNL